MAPPRLLATFAIATFSAAPPLAAAQSGPPPARAFGPDTTATGAYTGEGITPPGLTCDAPADPTVPLTCTGYLASAADGALLEATVRVPQTAGLHPLVVGMHGWGGSQGSMGQYDARLTADGYTYLRYSARGFGASWGQANLADVNVEGADLRSLVGQVVDDPRFAADPGSVGVFGASYGGAHSWLAALQPTFTSPAGTPVRVRAVAPVVPWSDLLNALVPNGRPEGAHLVAGAAKLSFVEALYGGGIRPSSVGGLSRPYPNYPDYLTAWNGFFLANEAPYAATPLGVQVVDGLQGYRSAYWQSSFWTQVAANAGTGGQVAVLLTQGFTDALFPLPEALRMYRALRAVDPAYPIAMYLGDVGHPGATNKSGEVAHVVDRVVAWFDWFLKGAGTQPAYDVEAAITRPPTTPFSTADLVTVATYDQLATRVATVQLPDDQTLTFDPTNTTGFQWDPVILAGCGQLQACPPPPPADVVPGDVATYDVAAARLAQGATLTIAGQPVVHLTATTSAPRVQLDVRVLDVASDGTAQLVTRGTYTVDAGGAPIGTVAVDVPTYGNLWQAPAGDVIRFEVTNVDSPYVTPSKVPSVTVLSNVSVDVPVRD